MIRLGTMRCAEVLCWPRTSGDDPEAAMTMTDTGVLAPHERG